ADMIEIDVQVGGDGAGVIMHDDYVDRTTDAAGPVSVLETAEVARLDAGSWKDPSFAGAAVPMFAQVLELLARFPRMGLLLEFKGRWESGPAGDLLSALASTEVADRTSVQSFDVETVRLLRELAPSVTSGLLVRAADEDAIALCRQLGVQVCNPSVRSVLEAPRSVAAIHDSGLRTF